AHNALDCRDVAMKRTVWDKKGAYNKYPRPLEDTDDDDLYLWFEQKYGITRKENIKSALKIVMRNNRFNPVVDYLDACEWDGVERLDTLLIDLFGADDTEYTRAVTRKTLVAAVARAYDAPVKFDYTLTIVGEQGTGKSSTIRRLANGWFSDSITQLKGKEAYEGVQGAWIIELPELASLRRTDLDSMKAFLTKEDDRFRPAYGARTETFPRRCIFIATTNEPDFLQDVTGNRRFWVVNTIGRRGTEKWHEYLTPAVVAQIWGEAKQRYFEGELLFLPPHLERVANEVQNAHLERDEREGIVTRYLETLLPEEWETMDVADRREYLRDYEAIEARGVYERDTVSVVEVWCECYGNHESTLERKHSLALARVLKAAGWLPNNKTRNSTLYGKIKIYANRTKKA
ncbi:virulence-associated E family protein, partial [Dysgonomonas sp. OttesenSCG-928-M03]|nr:virulence-associated E family protein [Dysgonomonas sp. OttesenSCG-928-M03]